jgi:hypothetical protein
MFTREYSRMQLVKFRLWDAEDLIFVASSAVPLVIEIIPHRRIRDAATKPTSCTH